MLIKNLRCFLLSFILTACIMCFAVGIILVDYNSAKNGFDEQHLLAPTYDSITGQVEGRIMGIDYHLELLSEQQAKCIISDIYELLPPQIRLITDLFM